MSFMLLGILNSQVSGGATPAFELISSQILTSSASSVTFSSIPSDYKHLQVRALVQTSNGNYNGELNVQFNGVGGTSYSHHALWGNGGSVISDGTTSTDGIERIYVTGSTTASVFGAVIIDILDYSSTNKNTTVRSLNGYAGSNGEIHLTSGMFNNTAAVTSITFDSASAAQNLQSGSRFSLYGVRG